MKNKNYLHRSLDQTIEQLVGKRKSKTNVYESSSIWSQSELWNPETKIHYLYLCQNIQEICWEILWTNAEMFKFWKGIKRRYVKRKSGQGFAGDGGPASRQYVEEDRRFRP